MLIDNELRTRLKAMFSSLDSVAAMSGFPKPASLSEALGNYVPTQKKKTTIKVNVTSEIGTKFATAATDMWLRAVHSFLISCSLTEASPVWSAVSGYYSSHYSVRALAHLLGYFQLFQKKRIVRFEITSGNYSCTLEPKKANEREHHVYWKIVKADKHFATDPLYTENAPNDDGPSDTSHRDCANYADHLGQCDKFMPLELGRMKARVQMMSEIPFTDPPIPRRDRFPDLESVQIVAYHRLVRFRRLLDETIGVKNRFWKVHRTPGWTMGIVDFQLVEQGGLAG